MTTKTVTIPAQLTPPVRVWLDRYPEFDGLDFGDSSSDSLYEED